MKLVVDTNILVSFFRESPVRHIIINPEFFDLKLYTSEHGFKELVNIKSSILKYSKLSLEQLDSVFEELKKCIEITPDELSISFEQEAKQLAPHDKDIPVFALALKLGCALWSNEPAFKKQSRVKVFNTKELLEELGYSSTNLL